MPYCLFIFAMSQDVLDALEGVTCVFHCASPSPLSNNRALFHKVNVDGTKLLISLCKKAGVKVVFLLMLQIAFVCLFVCLFICSSCCLFLSACHFLLFFPLLLCSS